MHVVVTTTPARLAALRALLDHEALGYTPDGQLVREFLHDAEAAVPVVDAAAAVEDGRA